MNRMLTVASSLAVLVAQDDPLDQYLVQHPADLFEKPPEAAVVDPTNPYVLEPHLACAAREQPLVQEELAVFGEGAAEDQVLDLCGIDTCLFEKTAHHLGCHLVRAHRRKLALAREMEGRAGIAGDHHVLHRALLSWSGPAAAACSATRTFLSILPIAVLGSDVRNS